MKITGQKEPATEASDVDGTSSSSVRVHAPAPGHDTGAIQDDEGTWLLPVLEQVHATVGVPAQSAMVVSDRRDLDGAEVWQVHHAGLRCVIVGASTMAVVQDAQGLATEERTVVRGRVVSHRHGTQATHERVRTAVVRLPTMTSSDSSGQVEETPDAHRRDDGG